MGMTRKDYNSISAAVKDSVKETTELKAAYALKYLAERLAVIMAADNPRFDKAKFMAACGVPK